MIKSQFLFSVSLQRQNIRSFDHYPFCLPVVKNLERLDFHPQVTILVGENGSGKSTLLEAIAIATGFNAEGGSRNFNFGSRASHSTLHEYLRVARGVRRPTDGYFLRAESFFNVATEIERLDAEPSFSPPVINSYGGRSLHEQSHGEAFLTLLTKRFKGNGLYILDEPEAALSPKRQLEALSRIYDLVRAGSQFIIATHSPILLSYPDANLFELTTQGLAKTTFEKTDHYLVSKAFLSDHKRMLQFLLSGAAE